MLLITTFVELRVVAERSLTRPSCPHAVSGRPKLIHNAMPCPCRVVSWPWEVNLRTAWTWHGMTCVNRTRPHCVNQMGKTRSKPLAARHGTGMVCVNHTRPHYVNQMGKTHSKPLAARHGNGMVYVNQTRPHCVNQLGKTQSKPLATLNGRETAW
jgi:hypothetical protein